MSSHTRNKSGEAMSIVYAFSLPSFRSLCALYDFFFKREYAKMQTAYQPQKINNTENILIFLFYFYFWKVIRNCVHVKLVKLKLKIENSALALSLTYTLAKFYAIKWVSNHQFQSIFQCRWFRRYCCTLLHSKMLHFTLWSRMFIGK